MRLGTYRFRGWQRAGAFVGDWVVDLERALGLPNSIRALLTLGQEALTDCERSLRHYERISVADSERLKESGMVFAATEVRLGPVVLDPDKIICVGRNYRAHVEEAKSTLPAAPDFFAKFRNSLIGPGEPIRIPKVTNQVDYEGELAVVMGRSGRYIDESQARQYVAGYTCFNDVSARDYQLRTSQWTGGKGFDGFAPIGPWIVTANEIPDPHRLSLKTTVSGETMQDANTADMVFTVPELISYISSIMTLEPGDVIATGTPAGVGFARTPPRYLRAGDEVQVFIQSIGCLTNPVEIES